MSNSERVVHITGVVTFVTQEEMNAIAGKVLRANPSASVEDVAKEIGHDPKTYKPSAALKSAYESAKAAVTPIPAPAPAPAPVGDGRIESSAAGLPQNGTGDKPASE